MKQLLPLSVIMLTVALASCNDSAKKIVVMSKGEADINTGDKTISAGDGAGHNEKTFVLGGGTYEYKLKTPAGDGSASFGENGLYVVNIKNDTILGTYMKYADPSKANATMTQDELRHRIDSLHLLLEGKNVSAANRNFFLLPKTAVRVSENTDAEIVGPYHQMRSAAKVDGKEPEVYRFYSIKEVRETVGKLEGLTVGEKQ
ncbi:hypothetical protein [Sediminibacterium soli]|uniref:hypothetical protein n=1 Tax=Sediminibacterium soli TaxID=2698829 RepID=UPI00137B6D43|nr:hypothetical protein [Sediminibacterium soli]NCI47786.1 hypothetical protein [Sediminibacterium soli]